MTSAKPRITAQIAGRALHPLLRPFAVGYFLTACAADLVYTQASVFVRHSVPEFADITEWLLIAGLVMAVLNNGLQLLGVGADLTQIIKGLVLLIAVAFDVYNKSQGKRSIIGMLTQSFNRPSNPLQPDVVTSTKETISREA